MKARQRISILEDNLELQTMLQTALTDAGYEVRAFGRASDFERSLDGFAPHLCLVDLGLPDKDGLGVLQSVYAKGETAILIVSARASLADKVAGLELGADDYLAKPFEISELMARVRALMRRRDTAPQPKTETVHRFCGWTADLSRFLLIDSEGREERLSAGEVSLLTVFLDHPNRLVTRDQLRDQLQDRSDDASFDRAIDVRVSRLRAKLKDSSKEPRIIKTIYGAGYILISDMD